MSVVNAIPLLLGDEGYNISRSVRLRRSASAYFNRTFGTPTNANIWTLSGWAKRGLLGTQISLFGASVSSYTSVSFLSGDTLRINLGNGTNGSLVTTQVFRDPSAYYHIAIAYDSTQATSSNRIKLYINGVQVTSFSTASYPSLNVSAEWNYSGAVGTIGTAATEYWDGYLTEVNFIDGQALTPSSFGETDAITGVWKPKKYAGTYGTNGFYLNFSDPSAATAAAIGADRSGNGNNWTPNNISVTAGVTYDSMIDVPTLYADGGNGRGNYCTLNPLIPTGSTLSEGNLRLATPTSGGGVTFGSIGVSSGKWYWEATIISRTLATTCGAGVAFKIDGRASTYLDAPDADVFTNVSVAVNDVYGIKLDCDNNTIEFFKNNVSLGSPTSLTAGRTWYPAFSDEHGSDSCVMAVNFGQRPFAFSPPTGFKALNTQNLPAPTILKGNQFFDVALVTGSASVDQTITVGFAPDFLWSKARNGAVSHGLYDRTRGGSNYLSSDSTAAEVNSAANTVTFTSTGATLKAGGSIINDASRTYVDWLWKANGSAVTNTSGSITSQVSAGVSQGFSVVTWTGTGSTATVGHGLGVAPAMIIMKNRTQGAAGYNWAVYHKSISSASAFVDLNTTAGAATNTGIWNATAPTSTVFSVGTARINNGDLNVAYCFSEVAGFSRFGSYTGNGSADGPFVFTNFKPKFVIIKRTDAAGFDWAILDGSRKPNNVNNLTLMANTSSAEGTNVYSDDFLSNGFKVRDAGTGQNANGGTYIYAAFAENPFKNSLAV
jgi:hypothetical protein